MKISFITTVKDDPQGLKTLLASLEKQTKPPDEVIVIDGEKTKTNRSQGRNLAIRKASGEVIAVSDAGCRLEKKWLARISLPFQDKSVDVVVGNYQSVAKNIFQKCLAAYVGRLGELPSSRSVAFRKKAWQKVNGYPEDLNYCEDLVFGQRLKRAGLKFAFAPKAIVFWPQRENLLVAFWQFFHYASGDAQALYWPHLKKIGLVFLRYGFGIWLFCKNWQWGLGMLAAYFIWAIAKNYPRVKHGLAIIYLPALQVTADLAVMLGGLRGLIKRL